MQLEVLAWVHDGCADGVYEDWSHRIVARALHNRGLVVVSGHGTGWVATLTEDGTYYLEHGTYPPPNKPPVFPARPPAAGQAVPRPRRGAALPPARKASPPSPASKNPGQIEQFIGILAEAGHQGIRVPYAEGRLYRQRAIKASRNSQIPEGMQLSFRRVTGDGADELWIVMTGVPAWQATVLTPGRTRRKGQELSDVVHALTDSETFPVAGGPRERALRVLDALVAGAREDGMIVTVSTAQLINRRNTAVAGPRRDEIVFAGEAGEVRLWFTQEMLQRPHEPTDRELNRARKGYLFPDHDEVPDEHLSITLDGNSEVFWGNTWKDTDEHRLEEDLAQILDEIRSRHEKQAASRDAEQRRRDAKQRQVEDDRREWDFARARAVVLFREQFVVDTMHAQAKLWNEVSELRRYAEAVRGWAAQIDGERRVLAIEWAEQIEKQSDAIDPLPSAAPPTRFPEPSREDLKPYMGIHGSFRP